MKRKLVWLSFLLLIFTLAFSQVANVPRSDLLIVQHSHGRVSDPANCNIFTSSWRYPARGLHQLIVRPLWMVCENGNYQCSCRN
jgi:hypothetical protein